MILAKQLAWNANYLAESHFAHLMSFAATGPPPGPPDAIFVAAIDTAEVLAFLAEQISRSAMKDFALGAAVLVVAAACRAESNSA